MLLTRLEQVVGAPEKHDLGSAGADPVQLKSEGLKTPDAALQLLLPPLLAAALQLLLPRSLF